MSGFNQQEFIQSGTWLRFSSNKWRLCLNEALPVTLTKRLCINSFYINPFLYLLEFNYNIMSFIFYFIF